MGQIAAKAKQGGDHAENKTDKDGKVELKQHDAKKLIEFMIDKYDSAFKNVTSFDEFYHSFHELIEQFCEDRGQMQYRMPSKKEIEEQYKRVKPNPDGKDLTKKQFMDLTGQLIKVDSFTFGKATMDVLIVLFGAPVCALLVKRIVPGLKAFSDDVVIPAATSGAVVYLVKANKL